MGSILGDYYGYFDSPEVKEGHVRDFAGGTLTMGKNGNAEYLDPTGNAYSFNRSTPLADIYNKNPLIANAWDTTYGKNTTSVFAPKEEIKTNPEYSPYGPAADAVSLGISPRSGLPEKYQESLLSSIIPQLVNSAETYKSDVDTYSDKAQGMYKSITDQLSRDTLPGTLNDLASRNVLDSSVASDSIAKTQSNIANTAAIQAYQTGMDAAQLKANYPQILTQIASLGSASTDDLAPYELLSNMLLNY